MSTRTLSFKFKVDGALTDATSAVLSDPTGSFGVKRTDTGAVVVAAGTALTHDGTGLYSYAITDPAAGLTYEYHVEVVYDGATYRFERRSFPPAVATAGQYLTHSTAAELIESLGLTRLAAKSDQEQDTLLLLASIEVDAAGPWQGARYDPAGLITGTAQTLEFPRVAFDHGPRIVDGYIRPGGTIWDWDNDLVAAVVPEAVKVAVCFQAEELADSARQAKLEKLRDGLAGQSVGSLSESYRAQTAAELGGGSGWSRLGHRAKALMSRYRLKSGKIL